MKIAVDGPSGAGKSTIAKMLAEKLGYTYIDTGAMYRSVGLFALRRGVLHNSAALIEILGEIDIDIKHINGIQHIFLCGEDVSEKIRTPEISMAASLVSSIGEVRRKLVAIQRSIAEKYSVIMDGRDIGTHVLPDADIKIFLTADVEERAVRRFKELKEKHEPVTYKKVLEDMKQRDYNDSHRAVSPLRRADNAVEVDTSNLSLDESVDAVCNIITERLK